MSHKSRKHMRVAPARLDVTSAAVQVEQLLTVRRFKEALKLAKILFQRDQTPAHRLFVERAYFLRFEQLFRGGMREGATQVAGNLLDFGVTDAAILAEFAPILPELGLGHKTATLAARIESPEARWKLTVNAADQAVLHPDKIGPHQNDLRAGVLAVRGALAALDARDEPLASDQLRDIPRSSPFADWRLFVRGLAALRRGEAAQVTANWDRLDPDRAAHKIARFLRPAELGSNGTSPPTDGQQSSSRSSNVNWPALETKAFGEPVTTRLEELQAAVRKQNWRDFRRLAGPLTQSLRRIDVRLAQRLTELLLRPIVDAEQNEHSEFAPGFLVEHLIAAAEPCPLDRRWNRLRAILCESDPDEREQACTHWTQYVKDIDALSHLTADDRRKMQALVYRHIGELYAIMTEPEDDSPFERPVHNQPVHKKTVKKMQRNAIAAIEESLRLDPSARGSYDLLGSFYDAWEQPEQVAATAHRLLAVCPDDLPTLQALIEHHIRRQEPEQAFPLAVRARRLKPLDELIATDEARARQGLARQHALAGRWDDGRAELARAQALWPGSTGREGLWARMAALEFKAGQIERAEELLREGQSLLAGPTVFWLHMSIESSRHQLGPELDARFSELLKCGLAKKVSSQAAGPLSVALAGYVVTGIEYPGKEKHIRSVAACLKRSTGGKFNQADLIDVCQFLILLPKEAGLFKKLVRKGVKAFPESVYFLTYDSKIEFERGPYQANRARMLKQLERAHELLEKSRDPHEIALGDTVKQLLGTVRNLRSERFGLPGGFPNMPPEMFDMFRRIFGSTADEGEEDDGEFDFFSDGSARKSSSRRRPH